MTKHHLLAVFISGRLEYEVVRVPARSEGDCGPSVGKIVHDRPLLGDSNRMMQRQGTTSRANLYAFGNHRQRRAEHGRIRVEAAEILKVSFGRPDGAEVIQVGQLRAL